MHCIQPQISLHFDTLESIYQNFAKDFLGGEEVGLEKGGWHNQI